MSIKISATAAARRWGTRIERFSSEFAADAPPAPAGGGEDCYIFVAKKDWPYIVVQASGVLLAGADVVAVLDRQHEHAAVADLAGPRRLDHRLDDLVDDLVRDHHLDLALIATEGRKAIDVLHITKQGKKLTESDQISLREELERMLEDSHEAR